MSSNQDNKDQLSQAAFVAVTRQYTAILSFLQVLPLHGLTDSRSSNPWPEDQDQLLEGMSANKGKESRARRPAIYTKKANGGRMRDIIPLGGDTEAANLTFHSKHLHRGYDVNETPLSRSWVADRP